MAAVIQAINWTWALSFLVVVVLYGRLAWSEHRQGYHRSVFLMALGITASFAGGAMQSTWRLARRQDDLLGDTGWMVNHPLQVLFGLLVISGAVLHIRTATLNRHGEAGWQIAVVLIATVFLTALMANWN